MDNFDIEYEHEYSKTIADCDEFYSYDDDNWTYEKHDEEEIEAYLDWHDMIHNDTM